MGDRAARAGAKARGGRGKKRPRAPGLVKLSKDAVKKAREDLESAMAAQAELKEAMDIAKRALLKQAAGDRLTPEEETYDREAVKRIKEAYTFYETIRRAAVRDLGLMQETRAEAGQGEAAAREGGRSLMEALRPKGPVGPAEPGAARAG